MRWYQAVRKSDPDVLLALTARFLISMTYGGMVGVLYNLFLERLGYPVAMIGVINGAGFLSWCVFSFPAGLLARAWGIRRSMTAGTLLVVVRFVILCLVPEVPTATRLPLLIVGGLIGGAGYAPLMACITPLLMGTDQKHRAAVFSLSTGMMICGTSIGALATGFIPGAFARIAGLSLASPLPFRAGLVVALGIHSLTIPLTCRLTREAMAATGRLPSPAAQAGLPAKRPVGVLAMVAIVAALAAVYPNAVTFFLTLHLDRDIQVPTPLVGGVMSLSPALSLVPLLVAPFLNRRMGSLRLVLATGVVGGACGVLIAASPGWAGAAAGFCGMNLAASAAGGAADLVYQGSVGTGRRTVVGGAVNAAAGLGTGAVLFGGGHLMAAVGYAGLVRLALIAQAASLAALWCFFRVPRREQRMSSARPASC